MFPTETVARFWLADYALRSASGAVRSDRFLSWDTFRQYFLPTREDQRPSSSLLRQLFVSRFLLDMRDAPAPTADKTLLWFAPTGHPEADERFSRSIAAILPQLAVVDDELLSKLPEAMSHDLMVLKDAYVRFLLDRNLFEPAYETASVDYAHESIPGQGPYCILFPQVIPDCDSLLSQLGDPDWITKYSLDPDDESGPCLEVFDNQLQEIRTQIRRIEALLEQGVPVRDIVVTCAGLEAFQDILQEEARLHEVPMRIVQGLSPLQYPAGRFFSSLKRVYDEQASLDSMKSLLLDPCYPWRDLPMHQRLIEKAVKLRIDHGDMRNFHGNDQWHDRLRRIDTELVEWYDTFKKDVRNICTSTTILTLQRQLNHFQDEFFIDEQWNRPLGSPASQNDTSNTSTLRSNPDADVYSFCMERIDLLDDALSAGGFSDCPGLFGMFLRMLETAKYVPQQEPREIPVYAWPLTAGMAPRYHFVLNMSHDAVQVVQSRAGFIPETVGDETLRGESDLTPALLALYRQTDDLQDGVNLSCSRQTYSEVVLPPSWFVEHGKLCSPDRDLPEVPDMFVAENLLWQGKDPRTKVCVHDNQKKWFEQALSGILSPVSKTNDMARSPIGDTTILRPLYITLDGQALLPLSATSLDLFDSCPFSWACRYLYQVEEQDFTVPPVDHRAIGNLIHSVYQRFFQTITERNGAFDPERIDSYRLLLSEIWEEELERLSKRPDAPTASTFEWIRYSLEKQLPAILTAEAKTFPDSLSWGYEYRLEETDFERGYRLEGRIDRIILLEPFGNTPPSSDSTDLSASLFAVVDYKKGTTISAKAFGKKLQEDQLASCQLPVYRRLMKSCRGAAVASGAYYSVKNCKYSVIWNSGDDESVARMDAVLDGHIMSLLQAVQKGDLSATPSKESCANCMYRQVCRRRFAIQ